MEKSGKHTYQSTNLHAIAIKGANGAACLMLTGSLYSSPASPYPPFWCIPYFAPLPMFELRKIFTTRN